ncbi:MAG TPA: hypothetical protein VM940_14900 [Chthoniobacterales bacterium]|jgi:hypothetical protein|nr:hypothetical protein [Chthoniobacterales bacterium]
MKPTIQLNDNRGYPMPKTDYSFQAGSMQSRGGRSFGSRGASIRAVSDDYFKNEARCMFATEAAFFSVIVMTAAVPLINSAMALTHLVRSFAAL